MPSKPKKKQQEPITRRQFLVASAILDGAPWALASEAVSTTAMEHPEWDMDERLTWDEWADRLNG